MNGSPFNWKSEAAVEHERLNLIESEPFCLNKRVTLGGPVGLGNNWNDDNRRRNFNANNDWSDDSEMTLAYKLGNLFACLLLFMCEDLPGFVFEALLF